MQHKTDSYTLKNASWVFKIFSTLAILISMAVLAWSWYVSLSVLKFHRPSDMCVLLGDDLWALAHHNAGLYGTLVFFQAIAYGGIFTMAYLFFQRAAMRRRAKIFLLGVATALVILDQLVWLTAPFLRFSQAIAGYLGLVSALLLIGLTLPPLFQMWFF